MPSAKSSTVLFDAVRGHGRQMQSLRAALEAGKLPHAMLFTGPSGVGKRRVAKALAQALVCTSQEKPCGACVPCAKVAGDLHPDIYFIGVNPETKSKDILLDPIRDLCAALARKPSEGGLYSVIIDGAERMTENAQNAFLKALEEPMSPTYFFLIVSDITPLLPTIRSRCQIVRFGSLSATDTEDILMAEDDFSPREASDYARLSQGSVEEALLLRDGGYREVVEEAFTLVRLAREKRPVEWPKVSATRDELVLLADALIRIHRDILILAAAGASAQSQLFFHDRSEELQALARTLGPDQAEAILESLVSARDRLLTYVNPRLISAQLLLDLGLKLF